MSPQITPEDMKAVRKLVESVDERRLRAESATRERCAQWAGVGDGFGVPLARSTQQPDSVEAEMCVTSGPMVPFERFYEMEQDRDRWKNYAEREDGVLRVVRAERAEFKTERDNLDRMLDKSESDHAETRKKLKDTRKECGGWQAGVWIVSLLALCLFARCLHLQGVW